MLVLGCTQPEKYDCGTYSSAGVYKLSLDIESNADCIIINGSNIWIDCQGHSITYAKTSRGDGVDIGIAHDNITVRNCNIIDGKGSTYSHGIYLSAYSDGYNISHNNFNIDSSGSVGIWGEVASGINGVVEYNNFTITSGAPAEAIFYGFYMYGGTIAHNWINVIGAINGILFEDPGTALEIGRIWDNTIIAENANCIYIHNAKAYNITLLNCTIRGTGSGIYNVLETDEVRVYNSWFNIGSNGTAIHIQDGLVYMNNSVIVGDGALFLSDGIDFYDLADSELFNTTFETGTVTISQDEGLIIK